ncbi:hypothetical protein UFOVP98_30 [uncultured Caudovirales phage]|uniref:Uncharacterized protein n=1 Tax=uncultured Caudovirales phage TaxID=2100421 RepID=A0A6J5LMX0_9CAUD|nr:hypothetical protein UFOVP98_30 [uncultured Caudovirales phage]CAB4134357.1 hypothetical protein UFOVP269_40 [uncultured Caudovirales phage]
MKILDLRDKEYSNDMTYYLTDNDDLLFKDELLECDKIVLKIWVNGFFPGTQSQWESEIFYKAMEFLKQN